MPLLFWPGTVGQFMKFLPLTLIATLSSSLIIAITIVPVIGRFFGKPKKYDKKLVKQIHITETGDLSKLKGFFKGYYKLLDVVLTYPKTFVFTIIIFVSSMIIAYQKFGTGVEFFPHISNLKGQ